MVSPRGFILSLVLCALLAGCSVPGARDLVVAASNYEARSLEAIAAVDEMARRETEVAARDESVAEEDFVQRIRGLGPGDLGEDSITQALRPFTVNVGTASSQRSDILDTLRRHHSEFTAIFANVERAGFLAQRTVGQRVPPVLDLLIAQQLRLARTLTGDGRPRLLGLRGELGAEIHRVRLSSIPDDQKATALRALRRRWIDMEAQEDQLLTNTTAALLRAAATGVTLREQVKQYGQLSLAQLESIIREGLGFVGAATGRDMTALSGQVEALAARITADPDFSVAARNLLERVPVPALSQSTPAEGD